MRGVEFSLPGMGDFLRHLFTPHHTNNHRARALHLDALLFYALALVFFNLFLGWFQKARPDVLGYATDIHLEQLLIATNAKRQEAGLSILGLNASLSQAAAKKAEDMFAKDYWAHTSPSGATPWEFVTAAGYQYAVAGENLAKNFSTSQAVIDAWIASPSHRDNLLKSNYKDIGFAIVNGVLNGEETTLVVQMFGSQSGQTLAAGGPVAVKPVEAAGLPNVVSTPEAPARKESSPTRESLPQAQEPSVVISDSALTAVSSNEKQAPYNVLTQKFMESINRPVVDITSLKKGALGAMIVFFCALFILDAWIVTRRRITRVAGHSLAHTMFFGILFFILIRSLGGSIL
ncbi:MAG: hypothetical protein UY10_C0003G0062 [Microgenomates group bacterium GW2011_GWA2_47_8]|nr:MAG: hypothetical protein UY10_C0003G0062 [Microgenomates group bacterium GW2011_GWA2_47_8]